MKNADLTPKQIAEVLDKLAVIEVIGAAIKARAIELAHAGTVIPGYEAAFTNARRAWSSEDDAAGVLTTLGLKKGERYVTELLSPAQAEKLLRKKGKWPKSKAGADFASPLDAVIQLTDTKPTIHKVR